MTNYLTIKKILHAGMKNKIELLSSFLFGILFFLMPFFVHAERIYLSPSAGTYDVGETFIVNVLVSSPTYAMNAVSSDITFSTHNLEVVSLDKTGSIINLWAQEPSFSNSAGTIKLEGAILNPGYQGAAGKVLSIRLRAKNPGTAALSFSSGLILANDGKGTEIPRTFGNGNYSISISEPAPIPVPIQKTKPTVIEVKKEAVPNMPIIESYTHPDQAIWYPESRIGIRWVLPEDITDIRFVMSRTPMTSLQEKLDASLSEYIIEDLENGTWYFHLQFKNSHGWSKIATHKFQINNTNAVMRTTEPEIIVDENLEGKDVQRDAMDGILVLLGMLIIAIILKPRFMRL